MTLAYWMALSVVSWMAAPEYDRDGPLLSVGAGVTHCAQLWCDDSIVSGMARLEVGWRFKWIAPVVYVGGGGTPLDPPEGEPDGRTTIFGTGVGARVFPNVHGLVDPYVGFGLGYSVIAKKFHDDTIGRDTIKRGAAVFTGGLSFYVARHLAIGPRFDYTLPFAGELCAKDRFGSGCTDVKEMIEDESKEIERANRRRWPRPWSLSLDLIVVF